MAVNITGMPVLLSKSQCDNLRAELVKLQKGRCALCGIRFSDVKGTPCLDHDHKTGLVRAALCRNCNGIEGKILDYATRAKRKRTPEAWLKDLLAYWEFHKNNPSDSIYYNHGKPKRRKRRGQTTGFYKCIKE